MNLSVLASTSNKTVDPKVSFIRFKIDKKLPQTFRCMRCDVQHTTERVTDPIRHYWTHDSDSVFPGRRDSR